MSEANGTKVPFNAANVGKCMCPHCPVQSKSKCAADKLATIKVALAKKPLQQEEIPGVYCSSGTATCKDLDPSQSCICGSCAVYNQHNLAAASPSAYYCRDGFAK